MSFLPDINEVRKLTMKASKIDFEKYFNAMNVENIIGMSALKGKTSADFYLDKLTRNESEYKPFVDYVKMKHANSGYKISLVELDQGGYNEEYEPVHIIRFDWSIPQENV